MAWQFFKDLPDTSTPLTASRLNALLDGEEAMGNLVVDSIRTKNMFGNYTIINGWLDIGIIQISYDKGERLAFIPCKKNTTYTVSRSVATSRFRIAGYANDTPTMTSSATNYSVESYIRDDSAMSLTYTTGVNTKYLIIEYCNNAIDSLDTILNSVSTIQLEEGSTATTFTKFQDLDPNTFDTGWIDMSDYVNTTNFTIRPGYNPEVRRIGNVCYWRGEIYCSTAPSGYNVSLLSSSIPAIFKPTMQYSRCGATYQNNQIYNIFISKGEGVKVSQATFSIQSQYSGYQLSNLSGYTVD